MPYFHGEQLWTWANGEIILIEPLSPECSIRLSSQRWNVLLYALRFADRHLQKGKRGGSGVCCRATGSAGPGKLRPAGDVRSALSPPIKVGQENPFIC